MNQNNSAFLTFKMQSALSAAALQFFYKSPRNLFSLLVLLLFCNISSLSAQTISHQPGKILVSIGDQYNAMDICRRFNAMQRETTLSCDKKVSSLLNTWLLTCSAGAPYEQLALQWLHAQPEIRFAQLDFIVELRQNASDTLLPNDPLFYQQWQYLNTGASGGLPNADLDAPQAWDFTTGGISAALDTVVVAVIDGGVDIWHDDLQANLWRNHAEIPDDGIDNDNNGYIDDYKGWNVWSQNDHIDTWNNTHGTPVSGILGARGNNGIGVSGVNWQVKIMFIAGSGYLSNILESLDYVYKARKRYNETQGQQGAFVVAVNCSWGINYGHPDDAPLLCAIFDTLGYEGILSIAATANLPINVDVEGDLPTTCPSPYLITVTSLKSTDNLAPNAAWGPLSIDLGAYGQNIVTTAAGNNYGNFSGTSFASPHVTGAVALAYAVACPDLIALAKANPQAGAMMAKATVLNSTFYNADLDGKVLTNGRLNLGSLAEQQQSECSTCPSPFNIKVQNNAAASVEVSWLQMPGQSNAAMRWRKETDSLWQYIANVSSPWTLAGLDSCSSYVLGLNIQCSNESSGWSYDRHFISEGCCAAPYGLEVSNITAGSAQLAWSPNSGSGETVACWKESNGGAWNFLTVYSGSLVLQDLSPCTNYLVKVGTPCGSDSLLFSLPIGFTTSGCGACSDLDYCEAVGQSAFYEYIASVSLNGWIHDSGNSGDGYEDFTEGLFSTAVLPIGTPFDIALTPGFWGSPSKVYFRVYLDINANGSFNDPGELLYDPGYSTLNTVYANLLIPDTIPSVKTRLRVVMKYMGTFGTVPGPCESFEFGQVEDYCVQVGEINTGVLYDPRDQSGELLTWPVPATDALWFVMPDTETGCSKLSLDVFDANGRPVLQKKFKPADHGGGKVRLDIESWKPGVYTLRLKVGERTYWGKVVKL